MTETWERTLAATRHEAARRCGLTAYPAELIWLAERLASPFSYRINPLALDRMKQRDRELRDQITRGANL